MSERKPSLLHIGSASSRMPAEGPFIEALRRLGELTIIRDADHMSDDERAELIRQHDILLTIWGSMPVPVSIATDRGRLSYICNISGELKPWIPLEIVEAGIPVTNWGDASGHRVAEASMTLLLAAIKNLHHRIAVVREDGWQPDLERFPSGSLEQLRVGIYGFGAAGRKFAAMIRPFDPVLRVYDPYVAELPAGCERVERLDELFRLSQAVVILAGLSKETARSVTAERLAMLPDHGIVVNAARGDIIDQVALFAELAAGRLRAGLDVLAADDRVEPRHPARLWPNCILTAHSLVNSHWNQEEEAILPYQRICLDNIERHLQGRELLHRMDVNRYNRST
ncbi:NAD(P)-dependent oxidoreductase [Paenibacillaceae bacterium WGS1546]|uniref:NAD(P)-dependent oxidoreductase n=1 Tax=Cohnella sp. WGS1546 TaxID=3366810 RepID=UPI00372D6CE6